MVLIVVRRRHASVDQVAAPSTFTANSFAPRPLQCARRPGALLRGDVVCYNVPAAVDHPLHVSGNRNFHLRSCCNEYSIEEGEKRVNFSFSSSSMPKRVDFLFIAAPARVDYCINIDRGGSPVRCEENSEFSSSSWSLSSSSLPERHPGR